MKEKGHCLLLGDKVESTVRGRQGGCWPRTEQACGVGAGWGLKIATLHRGIHLPPGCPDATPQPQVSTASVAGLMDGPGEGAGAKGGALEWLRARCGWNQSQGTTGSAQRPHRPSRRSHRPCQHSWPSSSRVPHPQPSPPTLGPYNPRRRCTLQVGLASGLGLWGHSSDEDPGTVSDHLVSRWAGLHQSSKAVTMWTWWGGQHTGNPEQLGKTGTRTWMRVREGTVPSLVPCKYKEVFTLRHWLGFCTPLRASVSLNFVPWSLRSPHPSPSPSQEENKTLA